MPAAASALRAASVASVAVVSPSPAIWRAWMPVRSTIHSWVVSTRSASSALVTRRGGSAEPVPTMTARRRHFAAAASSAVCAGDVGEILGDLAGQVLAHHPRRDPDRIGDALVGGAAMALHDEAVEAEEDRAIMVVGIEMVAQQFGRRARDQEADLGADRAGEGALAADR